MMAKRDIFTRQWITDNAMDIVGRYEPGVLTIRALHYQLVGLGMTNSMKHYKRVVAAMGVARWDGLIGFNVFSDRDRAMVSDTKWEPTDLEQSIDEAKRQIGLWMKNYYKNRWENQDYYPEVFIEKKALEGVFYKPCLRHRVALGACKGYPSLTFLYETANRMIEAAESGKQPIILYFGDYDPSGEDIPRAIEENLSRLGATNVEIRRIALMHEQVEAWNLPHAPAKETDSRTANWDGVGQVELDAVKPEKLEELLSDAIDGIFDYDRYEELNEQENEETETYRSKLIEFVKSI